MPSWDALPGDTIILILEWRRVLTAIPRAAVYNQRRGIGYRTRVLLGRFRMLR